MVAWGISTVVFAYVLTTSVGSLVGGAFGIVGQGAKVVAEGRQPRRVVLRVRSRPRASLKHF